eukprot:5312059-Pyramimonas_sp.AAC.1
MKLYYAQADPDSDILTHVYAPIVAARTQVGAVAALATAHCLVTLTARPHTDPALRLVAMLSSVLEAAFCLMVLLTASGDLERAPPDDGMSLEMVRESPEDNPIRQRLTYEDHTLKHTGDLSGGAAKQGLNGLRLPLQ